MCSIMASSSSSVSSLSRFLCSTLCSRGTSRARILRYAAGCVRRTFAMAFSPCMEKSLSNAEITASLSLLREPRNRPAGLPFRFSLALPTGGIAHAVLTRAPSICLSHGGDGCVLGAVERAGNALYGARVYVELGRRLAHTHAARQSRSDALSQLIRERRPAKALTFTLGPL